MNNLELLEENLSCIKIFVVKNGQLVSNEYNSISELILNYYPLIKNSNIHNKYKEKFKKIILAATGLYTESFSNNKLLNDFEMTKKIVLNAEEKNFTPIKKIEFIYSNRESKEEKFDKENFVEYLVDFIDYLYGEIYFKKVQMLFEIIEANQDKDLCLIIMKDFVFIIKNKLYKCVSHVMNFKKDLIKFIN